MFDRLINTALAVILDKALFRREIDIYILFKTDSPKEEVITWIDKRRRYNARLLQIDKYSLLLLYPHATALLYFFHTKCVAKTISL